MSRLARLRLEVTLDGHAWQRPDKWEITRDPDGFEWLDWGGSGPLWIEGTGGLLDAFVRVGRPSRARGGWSLEHAVGSFVGAFGPWGYCDGGGHRHLAFRPSGYFGPSGVDGGMEGPGWRTVDVGVGHPVVGRREPLHELVQAARQIDALRRINARLWGLVPPPQAPTKDKDWSLLGLPVPSSERDEADLAANVVNAWLRTTHVFPAAGRLGDTGIDGPGLVVGTAVGGAAGGLALAMLRELTQEPRIAICPDCSMTHLQQSNRRSLMCDACRHREKQPQAEAPGRAKEP